MLNTKCEPEICTECPISSIGLIESQYDWIPWKRIQIVIYFSSCQCYLRLDKLLTCQQQDLLYHHAMIGCSGKDKASVRSSSKNTFPSIIMWDKDKFLLECKEKEKSLCCWYLNSHGSPIPSVQKRDSLVQVHTLKSKCSSWDPSHGWTGCANCTTWQGIVEEGKGNSFFSLIEIMVLYYVASIIMVWTFLCRPEMSTVVH